MRIKIVLVIFFWVLLRCLHAQTTAIPDSNFENYLETHNVDGMDVAVGDASSMGDGVANNGLVFTDRIADVTSLSVVDLDIADLSGIEDFTNLELLICNDNRLSAINVSGNPNLTLLNISNNRISGALDVTNNTALESLFCSSNQISTLDVSQNTLLRNLDVSGNLLTNLDLSAINTVECPNPQTNPETSCQGMGMINVSRNQLTSLVFTNSYNNLVSSFDATENPDLFCIQIDAGFTPNSNWLKDDWAYFSDTTCVDIFTYVPDDNFEQALIDLGLDDTLDNLVITANINTIVDLDISNRSISNLVGIEDFTALQTLNCNSNNASLIDLSANVSLEDLNISNNNLSSLELASNSNLLQLNCANNAIETIDVTNNVFIESINCSNNNIQTLSLNGNSALSTLNCSFNQIEQLQLATNLNLTTIICSNNDLFSLNVSNGTNNLVTDFNATNNPNLFCIQVDDAAFSNTAPGWQKDAAANYDTDCGTYVPDDNFEQALIDFGIDSDGTLNNFVPTADVSAITVLDISGLSIRNLTGIEDFTALVDLNCSNNLLTALDLSSNLSLEMLNCSENTIAELSFTSNTFLTSLLVNNNSLQRLDIKNGNNALLATFNAKNNPRLFCITVDNATIGNIPPVWQKDDIANYNEDCENNRFTLIPDPFFEQSLIDLGYDNSIDGQVLTANIESIETLNVSAQSITNVTGVQDFKSLLELDVSNNFLEILDLGVMPFLERLNCSSNYLETTDVGNPVGLLNITQAPNLLELYCSDNAFIDLNVSNNPNLQILDCANNDIVAMDISGNVLLTEFNCSNNELTLLNIASNATIETVNCDSNTISEIITSPTPNTTLTSLSCADNDISTLDMMSYQALERLNCGYNNLSQVDIVNNTALRFLAVSNNQLANLNTSTNLDLEELQASQNNLSVLDINNNLNLRILNVGFNDVNNLDTNVNTQLQSLNCQNNVLTSLDLTNNANLRELDADFNMLSSLILSTNLGALKKLNISNNQIETDLDLSTMATAACVFQPNQTQPCPEFISVNVSNNNLQVLDIQNGINEDVVNFNATNNPNLDCIQVDDPNNVSASWLKDDNASYSDDCNFGETFVPDDNFEQALINLGYDSGSLNDYVPTLAIEAITMLDVSGLAIDDLTGIEDFLALEILNCSNNNITELYISTNTNLQELNCSANQLQTLDVISNPLLTNLDCAFNSLSSLDLSNNTQLLSLNISNNNFEIFLLNEIPSLQDFNADFNALTELNFQFNQNITDISCQSNALEVLNVKNGQNAQLATLNSLNNPDLLCIEADASMIPTGAFWQIDATTQISIECFFGQTFIPDDNFEQALINLGYDSGPLDDYVATNIIASVSFLNISSREISDLTGIQDFESLETLNAQFNNISAVDLSNNSQIRDLDISNNLLTEINLTNLGALIDFDGSQNQLSNIDFQNNLGLININISNNLIENITVDNLTNLVIINCSENVISSLDFTQNPNLETVFCQSNSLINDQLNLQNGNNENIQFLNASNNPDLGCILVDNPAAVITNADGIYDNWIKDDTASYQLICLDADNDGVANTEDLCPGTPLGNQVDLFGCPIPDIPNDNFLITVTSETCLNSNDGIISIVAQQLNNYTVTLESDDFFDEYNFSNDIDIFNLVAGTYQLCITTEDWPGFNACYTIVINQPDPLSVFASRIAGTNRIALDMTGSLSYNVNFNGNTFTTYNTALQLDLRDGINELKISTDLPCQGVFEKTILHADDFLIYPNPFNKNLTFFNGVQCEDVYIKITSIAGKLLFEKTIINTGETLSIDTEFLASGLYIIELNSTSMHTIKKIIKK